LNKLEDSGVTIVLLSAKASGDLRTGEEVTTAFALKIEDCIGLLEATIERAPTKGEYPRGLFW
jgi:hypothetical protein